MCEINTLMIVAGVVLAGLAWCVPVLVLSTMWYDWKAEQIGKENT